MATIVSHCSEQNQKKKVATKSPQCGGERYYFIARGETRTDNLYGVIGRNLVKALKHCHKRCMTGRQAFCVALVR